MYKYFFILIGIGLLLIPLADQRVFSSIPFYPLDYVAVALIGLSFFSLCNQKKNLPSISWNLWIGLGVFFVAALISFFLHDPNLTGLGQLKSWILLPASAAFLASFCLQEYQTRDRIFLYTLLTALSGLILILIPYLVLDIRTFDNRLQGPFTSPNFLAFFLMVALLALIHFWNSSRLFTNKFFFFLLGATLLLPFFLTHSFNAWFAFFGGIAWYLFRTSAMLNGKKIMVFALALTICGIFLITEITQSEKLETLLEERSSLASRLTIWSVSVKALEDSPLSGIGMGRFQETYLSYQPLYPPYLEWAVPEPHNLFLAVWLQTGLLGFLVFLFFLFKALSVQGSLEIAAIQSIFVGILLYGFFDTPLFGNALAFVFWFILALLLFQKRKHT